MEGPDIILPLLSGFAGALITLVLSIAYGEWKLRKEYHALLDSIITECDYDISIIDEVLEIATSRGTFKRLSVENFRIARAQSARYSMCRDLIKNLTRLCIDIDLFNLEADYIFNGTKPKDIFTGVIGRTPICVERKAMGRDIEQTIRAAREGVVATLADVRKLAMNELGKDDWNE